MPLPPALLQRLAKRGLVDKSKVVRKYIYIHSYLKKNPSSTIAIPYY